MTEPQVSVIIPTLNRQERLERAIKSVLAQTFESYEIIVVDGSGDKAVIDTIGRFDIPSTYIEQKGFGLSNARNVGITVAKGMYVAFLDDDDRWRPEKLARQIELMNTAPEDVAFVYTGIENVTQDESVIRVKRPTSIPTVDELLTRNYIGTPSSVLVRRSCLDAVGRFDESLPSREEWDLYIRLLSRWDAHVIPDPLVVKEAHADAMSRDIGMVERDWDALYQKHEYKYDKETTMSFRSNYHFDLCRKYSDRGEMDTARRHAVRSLKHRLVPGRFPYLAATCLGKTGYNALRELLRGARRFRADFLRTS